MNKAARIIEIARAEVGYLEKNSAEFLDDKLKNAGSKNYTKYGAWYGMQAQPWCAIFVSWCAFKAGITTEDFPRHASCTMGMLWFKVRERWVTDSPKAGDLVYFSRNGSTPVHVGLVYRVDGGRIYTVEGNTSAAENFVENGGSVAAKEYSVMYGQILGYGRPDYGEDEDMMTQENFNAMMNTWLEQQGKLDPSSWSAAARLWAESRGYIRGDERGNKKYKKPMTREELVQVLYNVLGDG